MTRIAHRPGRALAIVLALAGLHPAWTHAAADREIVAAARRVEHAPSADALVALGSAFMRKARETGDPSYYDRAAASIGRALAIDAAHYGALRARPWVLLGKHEFRDALRAARTARRLSPHDWWNYGNLA